MFFLFATALRQVILQISKKEVVEIEVACKRCVVDASYRLFASDLLIFIQ